jgi:hypothetical protein
MGRSHPEAAEAPAPELDQGEKVNPYVKRSLLGMPAASGAIVRSLNLPSQRSPIAGSLR